MVEEKKIIKEIENSIEQKINIFGVETTLKILLIRFLIYSLTAAWVSFYPLYLLTLHMLHEGFFSYDIFTNGVFGINAFFVFIVVLIIMFGAIFWGFIPLNQLMKKNSAMKWCCISIYVTLSIVIQLLVVFNLISSGGVITMIWVSGAGLIFIWTVSGYLNNTASKVINNWVGPLLFILLSASTPLISIEAVSDSVKVALKKFGVGGDLNVSVRKNFNGDEIVAGKLLLVTPGFIFLRQENSAYQSISRSDQIYLHVNK